jgi:hypothetical protein
MNNFKISAVLTPETESKVIQLVKDIKSALDFLVNLDSESRIRLAKLSRGCVDFLDRSMVEAKTYPGFLPSYLTLEEFSKSMELKDGLHRIQAELSSLAEQTSDTILVVESEAYESARLYYNSVKAAAQSGKEGAERIAKELAFYYKRPRSKSNSQNTDNTDSKTPTTTGKAKLDTPNAPAASTTSNT